MRREQNNRRQKWGVRLLVLLGFFLLIFSPLQEWIKPQTAQAYFVCVSETNSSDVKPSSIGIGGVSCPTGYGKAYSQDPNRLVNTQSNSCNTLTSCLADVIYLFTVGFGSAIAYVGAWMFSMAVALSLQSTAYALGFLSVAWENVRDIANMFFILILAFIAITIMLKAETSETMKRLAWVVVVALLINFSFFFVRVVIDTGNLLAIQFYNAIITISDAPSLGQSTQESELQKVTGGTSAVTQPVYSGAGAQTKDLTASIMKVVGIHTLLNNESFKAFQKQNNVGALGSITELIALSFTYIAVGIMFFMLAAAFFAIAIKFLLRTVVLWVVLFTSPLALVANTVAQGKKLYLLWQNALITHAFYPAVFLFLFYILTLLTKDLAGTNNTLLGTAFGNVTNFTNAGFFTYIVAAIATLAIYMGFVLILLYIALKAADKMGVWGAGVAQNFSLWATRTGSNVLYGGSARIGRYTLGRAASYQANTKFSTARNWAAAGLINTRSDSLLRRGLGQIQRAPLGIARLGEGRSYDPRNLPGGPTAKTLLKDTSYGLGPVNYDLGDPAKNKAKPKERQDRVVAALQRGTALTVKGSPNSSAGTGTNAPASEPSEKTLAALGKIKRAIDEVKYKIGEQGHANASASSGAGKQHSQGGQSFPHIDPNMNIYDILGAKIDATQEELKQRYYDLAKRLHPDATGGNKQAEEMLKTLNDKFDDIRRKKNDQKDSGTPPKNNTEKQPV